MQIQKYLLIITMVLVSAACSKFLDKKPSSGIVQPSSLSDLRNLLEGETITNTPALPILSGDEYYYRTYDLWNIMSPTERNSYIWAKDVFGGQLLRFDWQYPYAGIYYANVVMEALVEIDSANTAEGRRIRGSALFMRAYNFYNLVKCFARPYDSNTASTDPGIPLKLNAAIDEVLPRATVAEVYAQVFKDLAEARQLLPTSLPVNRNWPCVMAVDALLARISITMRDYTKAEQYADSCLNRYSALMDYATLPTGTAQPFLMNNEETLFATTAVQDYVADRVVTNTYISIDTVLLKMYDANDLRSAAYYGRNATTGYTVLKRGYYGPSTAYPFTGLATDEVYLIKAECAARRSDATTCLNYLNRLLVKRYKANTFVPLTASGAQAALQLVLQERRKELVCRGLRWDDLARLNKEGAGITLKRVLNGVTYTLEPNSIRYVFNIPADEIELSGISQNER